MEMLRETCSSQRDDPTSHVSSVPSAEQGGSVGRQASLGRAVLSTQTSFSMGSDLVDRACGCLQGLQVKPRARGHGGQSEGQR